MVTLQQVDPQFYAFRWITLLLSQEFAFPDTPRIWDTILSDPHGRMDCLLRICCAMILNVRERLMQVRQQFSPGTVLNLLFYSSSVMHRKCSCKIARLII